MRQPAPLLHHPRRQLLKLPPPPLAFPQRTAWDEAGVVGEAEGDGGVLPHRLRAAEHEEEADVAGEEERREGRGVLVERQYGGERGEEVGDAGWGRRQLFDGWIERSI